LEGRCVVSKRTVTIMVSIIAVAVLALALTGIAVAGGAFESDAAQAAGPQAEQAKAAALGFVPGSARAVERDGEDGATWEVEVTRPDGSQVDVRLDEAFKLVTVDGDSESPDSSEE
jgi:uncharacterized iron-regulated membrane protein